MRYMWDTVIEKPWTIPYTCKVAVSGSTAAETANQLAIGLEGEDAARLVVHHDDMSIPVHGYSLGAHEAASSNLGLQGRGYPLGAFS